MFITSIISYQNGGQHSVAVKAVRFAMIRTWVRILVLPETKIQTFGRPLHRRCPNSLAGSKWKTGGVKPN